MERALRPLFDSGATIDLDAGARSPQNTTLSPRDDDAWDVNQALLIAGEVSEYAIRGRIEVPNGQASPMNGGPGDVFWSDGPVKHRGSNIGHQTSEIVIVEVK